MEGDIIKTEVPEGYTLVKEAELYDCMQQIKSLQREVNNLSENNRSTNTEINDKIREIIRDSIRSNSDMSGSRSVHRSDDLVAMFEKKCRNSTIRSKVENVKSRCTNNLKKSLGEISSKQKESKKKLRIRFEDGQQEMSQLYESELMKSFQNKSSLNTSLPVEQYACEELVNTYRECMKNQLLPGLDKMYRTHCHKIDLALKEWVNRYTTNVLQDSQSSPAVQQKLQQITQRMQQISHAAQAGVVERKIDTILQKTTRELGDFAVKIQATEASPEEQIEVALEREDYNTALNHALVALNLDLLIKTCHRMSVDELFQDPPDQPILLALLNQMQNNLQEDLAIKSNFLMETVQGLDLTSDVITTHHEHVCRELSKLLDTIDETRPRISLRDYNSHLKQLRWATQQVLRQFE